MEHLEAKSLRLGNYVLTYLSDNADGIEQVTINTLRVMMENPTKKTIYEPIPLTEEWLIKFGYQGNSIRIGEMQIIFDEDYGNYYLGDEQEIGLNPDLEIKYVHQLQNLFKALTGEELTIKDK
jgi:hypothetical protein